MDYETLANKVAQVPLLFQPGSHFHYSIGIDVAGRIVVVASGKKIDAFFQEEIFNPLGMMDTYFHVPADQYHRLVHCCEPAPG